MAANLNIELGTNLLLDLTYKRGEERRVAKNIHATFIGLERPTHVAVRLTIDPLEKYHYFFSNMGDVVVKYILKGNAYAFTGHLLGKTDKPVPILYISYPDVVEVVSLRGVPRAPCFPPARVKSQGGGYRGQLFDVNLSGCRVDLLESYSSAVGHLAKGSDVELTFQLPGVADTFSAEGTIKWSRQMGDAWSVGISFTSMAEETQNRITTFMKAVERG